ncbi:BAHD acyltransferase BIA1-like [Camellia sinensis]|uniref:BAHD acyltransferase BIA1-like n=1 Tax=Camellia sinensis TaxID=4442 RepID=UPI001035D685|nr:BAHD acyltransferase BIA1-like [Camellia sinensis]
MKVEVIARETIEPSSPTPTHLQSFKLSLLDQVGFHFPNKFVLFYAAEAEVDPALSNYKSVFESESEYNSTSDERSQHLKKSLSLVLTRFYPLAGRIKDHLTVDCNDAGAEYVEALANCTLSDLLQHLDPKTLGHFCATNRTPFLVVQVTFLKCGGMALGISISHKITDAATFSSFIKAWGNTALLGSPVLAPDFTANSSRFAPMTTEEEILMKPINFNKLRFDGIPKRYVFVSSKISSLKAKATSASVPNPTRVETVSALIWKCLMATACLKSSPPPSPSAFALSWAINIRARINPPLPEHSFRNMLVVLRIGHMEQPNKQCIKEEEKEIDLSKLVCQLRKGIEGFRDNYGKELQGENRREAYLKESGEIMELQFSEEVETYVHNSWCRFPFYESDFGWGKPTWVSIAPMSPGTSGNPPSVTTFLDTKDGRGIEAWVTLAPEDMPLFETNPDLLAFASLNPTPLYTE